MSRADCLVHCCCFTARNPDTGAMSSFSVKVVAPLDVLKAHRPADTSALGRGMFMLSHGPRDSPLIHTCIDTVASKRRLICSL